MSYQDFYKYYTGHLGRSGNTLNSYAQFTGGQLQAGGSLQAITPYIIEERQMNMQAIDVFSRIMVDRIIFLGTGVDDQVANIINAQLLYLENADATRDVTIFVNSPGGSVYAGLGIYDVMQYVKPEIATVCTGMAASFGAVILAAGQKGKRSGLPHARIMIHQPWGSAQGQTSDIAIIAKQYAILKTELSQILADHCGKTLEQIIQDSDRDYWMRSDEAVDYGLIDEVIKTKKSPKG
jgi:ATP-dependent Clp protease protease subunit